MGTSTYTHLFHHGVVCTYMHSNLTVSRVDFDLKDLLRD